MATLEEVQAELERVKKDYEGACKLVADMHAAAVGEVRGPIDGPVEDVAAVRQRLIDAQEMMQHMKDADGVLYEVQMERSRQDAKWGQQNHPDGTAPDGVAKAKEIADAARKVCDHMAATKKLTWMHIFTEEVMEAFAETDELKLRVELIQAIAVGVAWVEAIDRRRRVRAGGE